MTDLNADQAVTAMTVILRLLGDKARAELRRICLDHSDHEDMRITLKALNAFERAYDHLGLED